jgi:flagellar biosynthesis/type III secretory pathway protein FliH
MDKKKIDSLAQLDSLWNFPTLPGDESAKIIVKLQERIDALQAEIATLNADYQKRIALMNIAIKKVEESLSVIDEQAYEMVQTIIAKCTKKLIHKELLVNNEAIQTIIEDAKSQFKESSGGIQIHLSSQDYQNFASDGVNLDYVIKENKSLNQGDILAKSDNLDVHGMLDERINMILGI